MSLSPSERRRVESYLAERLGSAVEVDVEVLADGLNLILGISTTRRDRSGDADGDENAGGDRYVLRRPRMLRESGFFVDLRTEYDLLGRLVDTPVPAPEPVLYCDDESVLGGPFLVMTRLAGTPVAWGEDLPARFRTPDDRRRIAESLVDTLAAIHEVGPHRIEEVCDRQSPRDQVAVAEDRLDRVAAATGREFPLLRSVADWLRANAPGEWDRSAAATATAATATATDPPGPTLVHGDYKPDNVLLGEDPGVAGVFDWETAALGDPLTEVGYLLVLWRDRETPTPSPESGTRHDRESVREFLAEVDREGFWPFTSAPGSPDRTELLARYERRSGHSVADGARFYRALSAFGLATVWADLHRHAVEAGDPSDQLPYVDGAAVLARGIADGEVPL